MKSEYLDLFAYRIETLCDGQKYVHILGYCYFNDEDYQCVKGTCCYLNILECSSENAEQSFAVTKQYQWTMSKEDVVNFYKDCKELRLDCVTIDTPDGLYVDY